VRKSSDIIAEALRIAVHQAFGEFKALEMCILKELGVPSSQDAFDESSGSSSSARRVMSVGRGLVAELTAEKAGIRLFPLLAESAKHKVLNLLDAFGMMDCFHPMWRNFDQLYQDILLQEDSSSHQGKSRAERCLQDMLQLPSLAKKAKQEGEMAIQMYEKEAEKLSPARKVKIAKHFARVEVMGYIIRMSLMSSVFPIVLRDIRDGLFRGIVVGMTKVDHSVAQLLRSRLVFNPSMEQNVFHMMEPSAEDAKQRRLLEHKRDSLRRLRKDFDGCQSKLARLESLLQGLS